jgi:hypothetical protein
MAHQFFVKLPNITFCENPFCLSLLVSCVRTAEQSDFNRRSERLGKHLKGEKIRITYAIIMGFLNADGEIICYVNHGYISIFRVIGKLRDPFLTHVLYVKKLITLKSENKNNVILNFGKFLCVQRCIRIHSLFSSCLMQPGEAFL